MKNEGTSKVPKLRVLLRRIISEILPGVPTITFPPIFSLSRRSSATSLSTILLKTNRDMDDYLPPTRRSIEKVESVSKSGLATWKV